MMGIILKVYMSRLFARHAKLIGLRALFLILTDWYLFAVDAICLSLPELLRHFWMVTVMFYVHQPCAQGRQLNWRNPFGLFAK